MCKLKLVAEKEADRVIIFISDFGFYSRINSSPLITIKLSGLCYSTLIEKLEQIKKTYPIIDGEVELSSDLLNYFSYSGVRSNANYIRSIRGF